MKKCFLSALLLIFCSTSMFFSCQNDETEMEPQSKIELLKAKSQEFAKKYGVDVTLNEDYLAKHADEMTVEGMEEDYKAFAELKNNAQHNGTVLTRKKSLSKKSFFARRKTETETVPVPDTGDNGGKKSGIIESGGGLSKYCCNYPMSYKATASWNYDNGLITCKLTSLDLFCNGHYCHSPLDEHLCALCKGGMSSEVYLTPAGNNWGSKLDFTATGSVSASVCAYTFRSIFVTVDYNENNERGSISISL